MRSTARSAKRDYKERRSVGLARKRGEDATPQMEPHVREWATVSARIDKLSAELAPLKEKKNDLETAIVTYAREHDMVDTKLNLSNGTILSFQEASKFEGLSQKMLKESLTRYFAKVAAGELKMGADECYAFILENRKVEKNWKMSARKS